MKNLLNIEKAVSSIVVSLNNLDKQVLLALSVIGSLIVVGLALVVILKVL